MKKVENICRDSKELDLSFKPRICNKCGHEAENGYQLYEHVWSELEDGDIVTSMSTL